MSRCSAKIAFVLHVMQVAGAEMLVAETIRRLGTKLDPIVFCLDGVGQLGEQMRSEGVPVISFGRRPGLDLSIASRLAGEIDRRGIEVVHAHQYTPFFYSSLAKLKARIRFRLIFTEHGRHHPDIVSTTRRLVNRWFLSHLADEINAVCLFSAKSLIENDGFSNCRIEVIENGIDVSRYAPAIDRRLARKRIGLDPNRRYVACVARFHPVKNHEMLIRAFAGIARDHPDVDLLLAGDGPLRTSLEQKVADQGLTERVRFLGVRGDVPELLQAADLFTLTSVSEAASLTLLEAMASALPVVVTAVGGNPEIVRHGIDGLLVPRGDSAAAARAYSGLLADPLRARRMGESARSRVLDRYRLDRTVSRYCELYSIQAAGARGGASTDPGKKLAGFGVFRSLRNRRADGSTSAANRQY